MSKNKQKFVNRKNKLLEGREIPDEHRAAIESLFEEGSTTTLTTLSKLCQALKRFKKRSKKGNDTTTLP